MKAGMVWTEENNRLLCGPSGSRSGRCKGFQGEKSRLSTNQPRILPRNAQPLPEETNKWSATVHHGQARKGYGPTPKRAFLLSQQPRGRLILGCHNHPLSRVTPLGRGYNRPWHQHARGGRRDNSQGMQTGLPGCWRESLERGSWGRFKYRVGLGTNT